MAGNIREAITSLRALLATARLPWHAGPWPYDDGSGGDDEWCVGATNYGVTGPDVSREDATLIATAINALPDLIAHIEALEAERDALQRALDRWLPSIAGDDERGPMFATASEDALLLMGLAGSGDGFGDEIWKDAERYRWLCEGENASIRLNHLPGSGAGWPETLNEAIDTAREAMK